MKKVLLSIAVFFVLLVLAAGLTSCSKEGAPKPVSITNRPVMLEYRINCQSANITYRYSAIENGAQVIKENILLRSEESIFLEYSHNKTATIEAWNSDGLRMEIILEIFAEGQLIASGSLNHTSGISKAEGLVY